MLEESKQELWATCEDFINQNEISCEETVYQSDWVISNAYDFIAKICKIVGYKPYDEDDDEYEDDEEE